jgi:tetratricopeptide (TPR) repeat protein
LSSLLTRIISAGGAAFFLLAAAPIAVSAEDAMNTGDRTLDHFLRLIRNPKTFETANAQIYQQNEILYCTGTTQAALANNEAAELMNAGNFEDAKNRLEKVLPNASLFMPFQYNLGLCYYHLNDKARARMHLDKARMIVPEYYLSYVQLGNIDSFEGKDDPAIAQYRDALIRNNKYINALVLIGDIYFQRKQITAAVKYYDAVLAVDPRFPNALLGKGKVLYYREQFYKAYQMLLMVDTKTVYDKSLHFYLAECAYKLQDYKSAYAQYSKLLEFKGDRFFITTSLKLIEHKQELAKRFTQQFDGE